MRILFRTTPYILVTLVLAGCVMGPDYQRPEALVPVQYKHDAPWKEATPLDSVAKGQWWTIYNNAQLNHLEQQVASSNLDLEAAFHRLTQAHASLGVSRSEQLPSLDLNPSASRDRTARDMSYTSSAYTYNQFSLPLALSYEIDLWGRVRRSVESGQAQVDSAVADYHNLMLSLQAELARNYFALRYLDDEIALLEQTIELRRDNRDLIKSRFDNGRVSEIDLARAEAELAATQAEAIGLERQRAEYESAIALLIGQPASSFSLKAQRTTLTLPEIAAGLPSDLLERRPDIASAERRMAVTSARIGVAKTAFFPAISLTGSAGYASTEMNNLFDWDNRTWGLGPAMSLPIFNYGRNSANLDKARAAYEEAVAAYRQQILSAFQEVENSLNALEVLDRQGQSLEQAEQASRRAWQLSEKRYRAGRVSYMEVVDSQRSALMAQRSLVQLRSSQMSYSVALIKALGGGWQNPKKQTQESPEQQ